LKRQNERNKREAKPSSAEDAKTSQSALRRNKPPR
jgi:hypothetical protein